MLLSSPEKLAIYTELNISGVDGLKNRRKLMNWQTWISDALESACFRFFELKEYTQDFFIPMLGGSASPIGFMSSGDPGYMSGRTFYPYAYPFVGTPVVKVDPFGIFNGGETTLEADLIRVSADKSSFGLWTPLYAGSTMRVTYTGGLGTSAVRSTFTYSTGAHTPLVGYYVKNSTATAVGIIRVVGGGSIQIDNLYGIFAAGDDLYHAVNEVDLFGTPNEVGTITAITLQSIAEAYPALEGAIEVETRYMVQHQMDFENVSSMQGQTTRRSPGQLRDAYPLQPETRRLLSKYINFRAVM